FKKDSASEAELLWMSEALCRTLGSQKKSVRYSTVGKIIPKNVPLNKDLGLCGTVPFHCRNVLRGALRFQAGDFGSSKSVDGRASAALLVFLPRPARTGIVPPHLGTVRLRSVAKALSA